MFVQSGLILYRWRNEKRSNVCFSASTALFFVSESSANNWWSGDVTVSDTTSYKIQQHSAKKQPAFASLRGGIVRTVDKCDVTSENWWMLRTTRATMCSSEPLEESWLRCTTATGSRRRKRIWAECGVIWKQPVSFSTFGRASARPTLRQSFHCAGITKTKIYDWNHW